MLGSAWSGLVEFMGPNCFFGLEICKPKLDRLHRFDVNLLGPGLVFWATFRANLKKEVKIKKNH